MIQNKLIVLSVLLFVTLCQSNSTDFSDPVFVDSFPVFLDPVGKQTLYQQFKARLLSQIASEGLSIGDRWLVRQQSTQFVIRDVTTSLTQDSRIAFAAGAYQNP